jgi:adenylate cyclase, class 2
MKEIELKILDINPTKLRKQLVALGAERLSAPFKIIDIFYKLPTKQKSPLLRLRKGKQIHLSTKKRTKDDKFLINTERQIEVSNYTVAREIINQFGFEVSRHREKKREEWKYQGIIIEIDTYPGIPTYMELETKNKKAALRLLTKLGIQDSQTRNWSATEVIKYYKKNPNYLVFK